MADKEDGALFNCNMNDSEEIDYPSMNIRDCNEEDSKRETRNTDGSVNGEEKLVVEADVMEVVEERQVEDEEDEESGDSETDSDDEDEDSDETSEDSSEEDNPSQLMQERYKELDKYATPTHFNETKLLGSGYAVAGTALLCPTSSQDEQSESVSGDYSQPQQQLPNQGQTSGQIQAKVPRKSMGSGLDSVLNQYHTSDRGLEDTPPTATKTTTPLLLMSRQHQSVGGYSIASQEQHFVHAPLSAASASLSSSEASLMRHYSSQSLNGVGEDYSCEKCGKVYTNRSSLRSHVKKHYPHEDKKFKCSLCSYSSQYQKNLEKHSATNHSLGTTRIFPCGICNRKLTSEEEFRQHRKQHTADNTYSCKHCSKQFKTKLMLKHHADVHNPDKQYVCEIPGCDRAFRTPKYLKNHINDFHKKQPKRIECPMEGCDQIFQRKSHLKRHLSTHQSEERSFHCHWPDCHKSFRSQESLNVHHYRHTGEKPFQCALCPFSCRQKSALNYHCRQTHAKDALVGSGAPLLAKVAGSSSISPAAVGTRANNTDVYAFTELDGQTGVNQICSRKLPDDSEQAKQGDMISKILHHLDKESPPRVVDPIIPPPVQQLSPEARARLGSQIAAIVAEVLANKRYNYASVPDLTPDELCLSEEMAAFLSRRGRKRRNPLELDDIVTYANLNKVSRPVSQFVPLISAAMTPPPLSAASAVATAEKIDLDATGDSTAAPQKTTVISRPNSTGVESKSTDSHTPAAQLDDSLSLNFECSEETEALVSTVAQDWLLNHEVVDHLVDDDGAQSGLGFVGDTDFDQDHLLAGDPIPSGAADLDMESLEQILYDLNEIESKDKRTISSSGSSPQLDLQQPTAQQLQLQASSVDQGMQSSTCQTVLAHPQQHTPNSSTQGQSPPLSAGYQGGKTGYTARRTTPNGSLTDLPPNSLDSNIWSESGYSSGHDSVGPLKDPGSSGGGGGGTAIASTSTTAAGSVLETAGDNAVDNASLAASFQSFQAYNSSTPGGYGGATIVAGRQTSFPGASPYPAASSYYCRSNSSNSYGSAAGDHLRSLSAMGPKYMDSSCSSASSTPSAAVTSYPMVSSSQHPAYTNRSSATPTNLNSPAVYQCKSDIFLRCS